MSELYEPVYFGVGVFDWRPHKKQVEVLRSNVKNKVIAAGRRGGKSDLIAVEWIRGALTKEFPKQACIAPISKQSKILFNKMTKYLLGSVVESDVGKIIETPYPRIVFKNGSFIDFASADKPDSLRGEAYDRVVLDEAGNVKDSAMAAIRPMLFDSGGPLWKIGTPRGQNHFFESFQEGLMEGKETKAFTWTSLDNPHIDLNEVNKEIQKYGRSSIYIKSEVFAEFVDDIGRVFKWRDIQECFNSRIEFLPKGIEGKKYVTVADIAKYQDFTVIGTWDVTERPYKLVAFDRFNITTVPGLKNIAFATDYVPRKILGQWERFNKGKVLIDSTGAGDPVLERLQKLIPRAEGFQFKSNEIKFNLIQKLVGFIESHSLLIPKLDETEIIENELRFFEYEKTPSGKYRLEAKEGFTDDCVTMCALAVESAEAKRATSMVSFGVSKELNNS